MSTVIHKFVKRAGQRPDIVFVDGNGEFHSRRKATLFNLSSDIIELHFKYAVWQRMSALTRKLPA